MVVVADKKEEVQSKEAFDAKTRCDQCQAQAYFGVYKDDMKLFFCIHHYNKNEVGLVSQGFEVDDRSWALS